MNQSQQQPLSPSSDTSDTDNDQEYHLPYARPPPPGRRHSASSLSVSSNITLPPTLDPYNILDNITQHHHTAKASSTTEIYRIEHDSLGDVYLPTSALYGPSTQRCIDHSKINPMYDFVHTQYHIPKVFNIVLCILKRAIVTVHLNNEVLEAYKAKAILFAIDVILHPAQFNIQHPHHGDNDILSTQFPTPLCQTGSLTHSHMNVNENIATISNRFIIDAIVFHTCVKRTNTPHESSSPSQDTTNTCRYDDNTTNLFFFDINNTEYLNLLTQLYDLLPMSQMKRIVDPKTSQLLPLTASQTSSASTSTMTQVAFFRRDVHKFLSMVHPNDDVNLSQSTNDVIPAATRIMAVFAVNQVLHALGVLQHKLFEHVQRLGSSTPPATFASALETVEHDLSPLTAPDEDISCTDTTNPRKVVKLGRTHGQVAVPIFLRDEIMCWHDQVLHYSETLFAVIKSHLYPISIGGSAVGNGVNTYHHFSKDVCEELNLLTGCHFVPCDNKFIHTSMLNDEVCVTSIFSAMSSFFLKMCQDIRFLASPGSGSSGSVIHGRGAPEYFLKQLEAGSSIMPSKNNPTQIETMIFVALKVQANASMVLNANALGQLQFNAVRPAAIYGIIDSAELLSNTIINFAQHCVGIMTFDYVSMEQSVMNSMQLATFFTPQFGYEYMSTVVKECLTQNESLESVLIKNGKIKDHEDFMRYIDFDTMCGPQSLQSFRALRCAKVKSFEKGVEVHVDMENNRSTTTKHSIHRHITDDCKDDITQLL